MNAVMILMTLVAASTAQIVFPTSDSSRPYSSGGSSSGGSSDVSSLARSGGGGNGGGSGDGRRVARYTDVDSELFLALTSSNRSLSSSRSRTVQQGSQCRTPDGNRGTCRRLSQCKFYLPQFSKIFRLIDYFLPRVCSFTLHSVLVCCPASTNRPQPRPATNPIPQRPPPNPVTRPTKRPPPGPIVPNSLFPTVCGNSVSDRVIGGTEIQPGAYPWLVALGRPAYVRFAVGCGGSLITRRHVLTAAHCFDFDVPSHVRIGEHNVNNHRDGASPQDLRITNRNVHRRYNKDLSENDIALVTLERDVAFNRRILPICLPFRNDLKNNDFARNNLDVVGWGTTGEHLRRISPIPHEAKVQVTTLNSCQSAYRYVENVRITQQQLCAGDAVTDSCQGDSGGPLNYLDAREDRYYLAGITSTGVGCGRAKFPGVYVRVGAYLDWIVSNVQ